MVLGFHGSVMGFGEISEMASSRGGAGLARKLDAIGRKIATANSVRVGFLENATYPAVERGAGKLLKGLDKLNRVGPHLPGKKPSSVRKYNKRRKEKAAKFVGPPTPLRVLHVAQVAWWNEYGTSSAPSRPFMRNTIAADSKPWGQMVAAGMAEHGYNSAQVLKLLGEHIRDRFVKAIVDWPADNAPLTVAIKGFNKGLIDQGIMQRHVDYEVTK